MNKKLFAVLVVLLFALGSVSNYILSKKPNDNREKIRVEEKKRELEKITSDEIYPVLKLTLNKLVIYQGDKINYNSFIKEATDNLDGDIISNVQYNKIDTTKIGMYTIEYKCVDSASNETTAQIEVEVKQKVQFNGNAMNGRTE